MDASEWSVPKERVIRWSNTCVRIFPSSQVCSAPDGHRGDNLDSIQEIRRPQTALKFVVGYTYTLGTVPEQEPAIWEELSLSCSLILQLKNKKQPKNKNLAKQWGFDHRCLFHIFFQTTNNNMLFVVWKKINYETSTCEFNPWITTPPRFENGLGLFLLREDILQ